MKSLIQFIKEACEEELELRYSINYEQFSELLMFLDAHKPFNDRKQAICDVFRRSYKTNLTEEDIKASKVFQQFIDDVVKFYNEQKKGDENIVLNVATRKHLEDDIAGKMLVKINIEQELPKPENQEAVEL